MEHVPAPLNDAVLPVTEHAPLATKLIVKPELALAERLSEVPAS